MYRTFDFSPYYGSPELLAKKFLELYFNGDKPSFPIDSFKMLSDLGIPFTFRDLKKLEGVYLPPENNKDIAVVGINRNRPILRQRFTAAHELCHHIKDKHRQNICPVDGIKNAIERFAEDFAAALLMPIGELKTQVALFEKNGVIDLDDVLFIADYFAVSFQSCVFRIAYKLGKLSGDIDSPVLAKRIKKFKPAKKRGIISIRNNDVDLFKRVLDNALSYFIFNTNKAVWYKFKANFVFNENRLEGLDIEYQTVSEIITDLRLKKQKSEFCKDEYETVIEVAGHVSMYDYICETEDTITSIFTLLSLNRMLYQYAPYPDGSGKTRDSNNLVLGAKFETVDCKEIPNALIELDKQLKSLLDNIESISMSDFVDEALKIHHRITVIHPFHDGNGRTSRVFLNWLFKLKGIPPIYLKAEKKHEYFDALRQADLSNDYKKLREVFYKAIVSSFIELSDYPEL